MNKTKISQSEIKKAFRDSFLSIQQHKVQFNFDEDDITAHIFIQYRDFAGKHVFRFENGEWVWLFIEKCK